MNEIMTLARHGMAVLFISSEFEEVVRVSDRIAVMRDRRKVGELPGGSSTGRRVPDDRGDIVNAGNEHERGCGQPRAPRPLRTGCSWPVLTLIVLLTVNASFNPSIWHLQWRDGPFCMQRGRHRQSRGAAALIAMGIDVVIRHPRIDISVAPWLPFRLHRGADDRRPTGGSPTA